MNNYLLLLIVGIVGYFLYKNNQKKHSVIIDKPRLEYFNKKYEKQLANINISFSRIQNLNKLFFDAVNLNLIKLLIEDDPNKYDEIAERSKSKQKSDEDEYEKWIRETDNQKIIEFKSAREMMRNCNAIYLEFFDIWKKAMQKHIKNQTETELELYLDDMFGASLYYDAFHHDLSKDKILTEHKSNELLKRLEKLNDKLNSLLNDCKQRYFETKQG